MKKSDLLPILEQLGIRPSRQLGQNFLIDTNITDLMLRIAAPATTARVVEVGPGTGVLTRALLDHGVDLTAVEFDRRLADYLRQTFADNPAFRLIERDACRICYDELMGDRKWECIANTPYSISSPLIGNMLDAANRPVRMTLLLQREMAERIAATHGNKTYGALSVRAQSVYHAKVERIISPTVFWPQPDVESAILSLALRDDALAGDGYRRLKAVVAAAFAQRRKKLLPRLQKTYQDAPIAATAAQLGLTDDARAEHVSVEQYRLLAAVLNG
jgi:16S rRNA (adenine1518-N6/adenine1519-N6)-dimethyltransferase